MEAINWPLFIIIGVLFIVVIGALNWNTDENDQRHNHK